MSKRWILASAFIGSSVYMVHLMFKDEMKVEDSVNAKSSLELVQHGDVEIRKSEFLKALYQVSYLEGEIFWNKMERDSGSVLTLNCILKSIQSNDTEYPRYMLIAFERAAKVAAGRKEEYTRPSSVVRQSMNSILLSTGEKVKNIARGTRVEIQSVVHRTVQKYLVWVLDIIAMQLKRSMKDEDMPVCLKSTIDTMVDNVMPDIKVEIAKKTRDYLSPTNASSQRNIGFHRVETYARSIHSQQTSRIERFRAFVLYQMFPYDKSIWGNFKNPYWYAFTVLGMVPILGQCWWILLFLMKDKTNEHQLCAFIIGFKTAQFFSLGAISTILGVLKYIRCTTNTAYPCTTYGPGLEIWEVYFFMLQILLVWTAFFRLPYSKRNDMHEKKQKPSTQKLKHKDFFGNTVHLHRGGHLIKLCTYETLSLFIIILLATSILLSPYQTWQKKALLYWSRTLYGLFSLPFVPFKVPFIASILTHTKKMGYNQFGQTVPTLTSSLSATPHE